jgi:hypothetical protein
MLLPELKCALLHLVISVVCGFVHLRSLQVDDLNVSESTVGAWVDLTSLPPEWHQRFSTSSHLAEHEAAQKTRLS